MASAVEINIFMASGASSGAGGSAAAHRPSAMLLRRRQQWLCVGCGLASIIIYVNVSSAMAVANAMILMANVYLMSAEERKWRNGNVMSMSGNHKYGWLLYACKPKWNVVREWLKWNDSILLNEAWLTLGCNDISTSLFLMCQCLSMSAIFRNCLKWRHLAVLACILNDGYHKYNLYNQWPSEEKSYFVAKWRPHYVY